MPGRGVSTAWLGESDITRVTVEPDPEASKVTVSAITPQASIPIPDTPFTFVFGKGPIRNSYGLSVNLGKSFTARASHLVLWEMQAVMGDSR